MRQDLNINQILSKKYPDASREPYCFNLSHFVKDNLCKILSARNSRVASWSMLSTWRFAIFQSLRFSGSKPPRWVSIPKLGRSIWGFALTLIRVPASGQWDWSPELVDPWARYRVIKKKKKRRFYQLEKVFVSRIFNQCH